MGNACLALAEQLITQRFLLTFLFFAGIITESREKQVLTMESMTFILLLEGRLSPMWYDQVYWRVQNVRSIVPNYHHSCALLQLGPSPSLFRFYLFLFSYISVC